MTKIILFITSFLVVVYLLSGCRIDNYVAPSSEVYGWILDSKTGEPVPQPVEAETGLKMRLYEAGPIGSRAQDFYALKDGSFKNAMLYDGPFKLTMEATNFFPVDTIYLNLKGSTLQNISVTPFCRINVGSIALSGDSIVEVVRNNAGLIVEQKWRLKKEVVLSFSLERDSNMNCKLMELDVYWNVSPSIDKNSVNFKGALVSTISGFMDESLLAEKKIFENTIDFETGEHALKLQSYIQIVKGNKNLVYFRIAAKTSFPYFNASDAGTLYTNYSKVYALELPLDK